MRYTDEVFRYSAEITKAEQNSEGDWVFDAVASLPGKDLQGEGMDPMGLETDYFFGKGLPKGAGGYIGYDHKPGVIVGVPLDGKISPSGFRLRWKGIKTAFMQQIVDQMRALREAGWPRRYGMSVEGVVRERDPEDPSKIRRAFIRNVDLTPTPVHPGTWTDFAKSLSAASVVEYHPDYGVAEAVSGWAQTVAGIARGDTALGRNPYFRADGRFRRDRDLDYFRDVHGLPEGQVMRLARYALSRQDALLKALVATASRGPGDGQPLVPQSLAGSQEEGTDRLASLKRHLLRWKRSHPGDQHITSDGRLVGGAREAAKHFLGCEHRNQDEAVVILRLLRELGVLRDATA